MISLRPFAWGGDVTFAKRVASDPVVREGSFDPRLPTWPGHLRWFWRHQREARGWVAWADDTVPWLQIAARRTTVRVGVVTFAWHFPGMWPAVGEPRAPFIGVALRREARRIGLGGVLIAEGTALILRRCDAVYAEVKDSNAASLRAFARAGYRRLWLTDAPAPYWTLCCTATDLITPETATPRRCSDSLNRQGGVAQP